MGKILETLKQGAAQAERATPPDDTEPAVPFIEVGSRRGPVEASPEVLASMRAAGEAAAPPPPGGNGPHFRLLAGATPEGPTLLFRPLSGPPAAAEGRFAPAVVAFHQPDGAAARQYESLAAALSAQVPPATPQVLLFSAASPGVPATTTLLNLAVTFARGGDRRVAVVEAGHQRPALADLLGLGGSPGMLEVLSGRALLAHALRPTAQANLFALPAGRERRATAPRWTADGMRGLFRELRQQCDLILVDAPAWEEHPESAALATVADAVYLVSSAEEPAIRADLLQALSRRGVPLRGQILTG